MPKIAVESGFARRGWNAALPPDAAAAYQVAQDLGVGYTTLITHLHRTLGLTSTARSDEFRRTRLPALRNRIAGFKIEHDLLVADEHWGARPIDLQVGDVVLVAASARFEGHCVELVRQPVPHLLGIAPGEGLVALGAHRTPTPTRVSRRGFSGLALYRFLEDPEHGA